MALLTMGVTVGTIHAADEDTAASVYLVFDPETGEFQTSQDIKRNSMHQAQQEAIDSVAPVDGEPALPSAVAETFEWSPKIKMAGWIILAALVLIVVAYFRVRKRTRTS